MAATGWGKMLRDHIFNCKQEAEEENWKWRKARNYSQRPAPVTYFPQQGTESHKLPPQTWLSIERKAFKCRSSLVTFLVQTSTGFVQLTILEADVGSGLGKGPWQMPRTFTERKGSHLKHRKQKPACLWSFPGPHPQVTEGLLPKPTHLLRCFHIPTLPPWKTGSWHMNF